MQVVRHLAALAEPRQGVVLTLGNFDGVHQGHQAILERARAAADRRGGQVVAFTFHPHPVAVLAPERRPAPLQTLRDRLHRFRALGVDLAVVRRFTRDFSTLEPEAFVETVLLPKLAIEHVVVGHRVSFGRERRGNATTFERLGAVHGFSVEEIGSVVIGEHDVSSSAIRHAISQGDVVTARTLLGRPWSIRGRVVPGDGRGRTIGFPTANLHLRAALVRPPDGVYAARVAIDGRRHGAVLNLGERPTFGTGRRALEVHVLDVDRDLYGSWLEVDFVERLRGERRFDGVQALRRAIAHDVARARTVLTESPGDAK